MWPSFSFVASACSASTCTAGRPPRARLRGNRRPSPRLPARCPVWWSFRTGMCFSNSKPDISHTSLTPLPVLVSMDTQGLSVQNTASIELSASRHVFGFVAIFRITNSPGREKGTGTFVRSTRRAVPAKGACPLFPPLPRRCCRATRSRPASAFSSILTQRPSTSSYTSPVFGSRRFFTFFASATLMLRPPLRLEWSPRESRQDRRNRPVAAPRCHAGCPGSAASGPGCPAATGNQSPHDR